MWLFTKIGFYSVVQLPKQKAAKDVLVRARDWDDLDRLKDYIPNASMIVTTEDSDYRYRFVCKRKDLEKAVARLIGNIDYDNFKREVAKTDKHRAHVYADVWATMARFQDRFNNGMVDGL